MKKQAQLALTLMPLIAIALALAALFAFTTFDEGMHKKSDIYVKLMKDVEFSKDYVNAKAELIWSESLRDCSNCTKEQLRSKFKEITRVKGERFRYKPAENFYGRIHRGEFEIITKGADFEFKMEDVFVEVMVGENKIRREFSIAFPKDLNNKTNS